MSRMTPATAIGRGRLVVALLVVLVVAAGALTWRLATAPDAQTDGVADPSARPTLDADGAYEIGAVPAEGRDALAAAVEAVPLALAYDHTDLDASLAAATSRMTPELAEEFRATFASTVEPLALEEQAAAEARVRAAGVVAVDGEVVTTLVFVDQVLVTSRAMRSGEEPVQVGQTRVRAVMTRVGEAWKLSDLDPL